MSCIKKIILKKQKTFSVNVNLFMTLGMMINRTYYYLQLEEQERNHLFLIVNLKVAIVKELIKLRRIIMQFS